MRNLYNSKIPSNAQLIINKLIEHDIIFTVRFSDKGVKIWTRPNNATALYLIREYLMQGFLQRSKSNSYEITQTGKLILHIERFTGKEKRENIR